MIFVIFLLAWAGLHAYITARLLSIPLVAHYLPPHIMVPAIVFLGASYIASRIMEHYELDGISHVLEYIGASWVGIAFVIFATLLGADVVTGFGFFFAGDVLKIREIALATAAALVAIAYVQAWRTPVVTSYEVAIDSLPREADGTVLVAVSDLHLGSMLGKKWARQRAAQIANLGPDLLVLVGDIFEGEKETHENWLPVLKLFRAKHAAFAVTGNHEFYAGPEPILTLFQRAGFHVLRDQWEEVFAGLIVAGVDDPAFRKHGRREQAGAVEKALHERPEGATIFLSHTPILEEQAAKLGANLMLSGHTHEGQIWPFNYVVRLAFKLVRGRYEVNRMTAIVGRGTGTWGPRMRLWKRSEILRITLRSR